MHRLFIPPNCIEVNEVSFPPEVVSRLSALELSPGDHLIVLDDSGWEHEVILTEMDDRFAVGRVVKKTLAAGERRTKISLYQGAMPPEDFEEVLRLGTQLGIVEFVPVVCERCELPDPGLFGEAALARWREIITPVAEQTLRGRLPRVRPAISFDAALERMMLPGKPLIVWDSQDGQDVEAVIQDKPFSIHLLAPPPDGFTPQEVERAIGQGIIPVRPPFDLLNEMPVGLLTCRDIFNQLG